MAVKSGAGKISLGGGKTRTGDFVRTRRRAEHPETTFIAVVIVFGGRFCDHHSSPVYGREVGLVKPPSTKHTYTG